MFYRKYLTWKDKHPNILAQKEKFLVLSYTWSTTFLQLDNKIYCTTALMDNKYMK